MMHSSDNGTYTRNETATSGGNEGYYKRCKKCDRELWMCICWYDLMDTLDRITTIKIKLDIYKFLIKKSIWIIVTKFIRRTPTSISGMKGLKLLKRIDKI